MKRNQGNWTCGLITDTARSSVQSSTTVFKVMNFRVSKRGGIYWTI